MDRALYGHPLFVVQIRLSQKPLASISIPWTARIHNNLHVAIKPSGMNHGKKDLKKRMRSWMQKVGYGVRWRIFGFPGWQPT